MNDYVDASMHMTDHVQVWLWPNTTPALTLEELNKVQFDEIQCLGDKEPVPCERCWVGVMSPPGPAAGSTPWVLRPTASGFTPKGVQTCMSMWAQYTCNGCGALAPWKPKTARLSHSQTENSLLAIVAVLFGIKLCFALIMMQLMWSSTWCALRTAC